MNILVVDDEKEIADVIELYLQNDQYSVYKFYTGEDALACIRSMKIDLAILDIMLPKMREIPGIDMSTIEAALTPLNLIMSVISCICSIAAGIFGLSGRSKRGAVVCAGIYLALVLVSVVQMVFDGTFTVFVAVDFILPVLYLWGLYQSE